MQIGKLFFFVFKRDIEIFKVGLFGFDTGFVVLVFDVLIAVSDLFKALGENLFIGNSVVIGGLSGIDLVGCGIIGAFRLVKLDLFRL